MSTTVTINMGTAGKQVVVSWREWHPVLEMRWLAPPGYTQPNKLQQKWERYGLNSAGCLAETEEEWRDVPLVTDESYWS